MSPARSPWGREGPGPSRAWLRAEFAALYLVLPIFLAVALPPGALWLALPLAALLAVVLLHRTPGFRWRELARGWGRADWWLVAALAAATATAGLLIVVLLLPGAAFGLVRHRPGTWLLVMALYPLLSALPQELVFRALFFRRYTRILPAGHGVLLLNAALFALAHLLYWSWIVAAMTFAGGLVFAWAFAHRRSFLLAFVLHASAGDILFTLGAGALFFTGAVVRPF